MSHLGYRVSEYLVGGFAVDVDTEQRIQLQHHQHPHHDRVDDEAEVGDAVHKNEDGNGQKYERKYDEYQQ